MSHTTHIHTRHTPRTPLQHSVCRFFSTGSLRKQGTNVPLHKHLKGMKHKPHMHIFMCGLVILVSRWICSKFSGEKKHPIRRRTQYGTTTSETWFTHRDKLLNKPKRKSPVQVLCDKFERTRTNCSDKD